MPVNSVNSTSFSTNSIPDRDRRIKTTQNLWSHYGWDQAEFEILSRWWPDFLYFLIDSKLIYSLRGFQHIDVESPLKHPYRIISGTPHLLIEGKWTPWPEIDTKLTIDRATREIISRTGEPKVWNFLYPNGLVCETRFYSQMPQGHKSIRQAYQLSEREMDDLRKKATPRANEKTCFVQVFSSVNGPIKEASHNGIVLIDSQGAVYSLGYETPKSEPKFEEQKFIGTYDVSITSLDYDTFAPFDTRRVTTLPISQDQFNQAFQRAEYYANKPIRFNRIHQNCTLFAKEILDKCGYRLDLRRGFFTTLADIMPIVGPTLYRVNQAAKRILDILNAHLPSCLTKPTAFLWKTFVFIPNKITTLITNLFYVAVLNGNAASPANPAVREKSTDNSKEMTYFDRLYSNWKDYFREDLASIISPVPLVRWQEIDMKACTTIHPFAGPKFYI